MLLAVAVKSAAKAQLTQALDTGQWSLGAHCLLGKNMYSPLAGEWFCEASFCIYCSERSLYCPENSLHGPPSISLHSLVAHSLYGCCQLVCKHLPSGSESKECQHVFKWLFGTQLLLFSYFRFCCHHTRKLLPSHRRSLPHSIWRHEICPHCWIMYPNPPTTSPYSSRTPMLAASCWKNNVLDAGPAWIPANFRVN